MRFWKLTSFCLLGLLLIMGWGCSDEGRLLPNLPPETTLFVDDGSLHTTHYQQILSWHGEDQDGEVIRFEYKWTFPEGAVTADFDTTWVGLVEPFVEMVCDTFLLPLPTEWHTELTANFQIRAVDTKGLADPTPASADFRIFNRAPILYYKTGGDTLRTMELPTSILPVCNLDFMVIDPDNMPTEDDPGVEFIREIRFWFEDPAEFISLAPTDTLLILDDTDFGENVGVDREFHLQAFDLAGAGSNILEGTAFVRDISAARVLILDSAGSLVADSPIVDAFWRDEVISLFPAEEVVLHDFENDGQLGHKSILNAIFSLFEAVIWYNGNAGEADMSFVSSPTPEITAAEEGLVEYLEQGGHALLTGFNLLGASRGDAAGGSFSAAFEEDVILVDSLLVHSTNMPAGVEASPNWWHFTGQEITGFPEVGTHTLRNQSTKAGTDRMALDEESIAGNLIEELYRVAGSTVYPPSTLNGAAGVRRVYEASGGELVLLTFPVSLADGYDNALEDVLDFLRGFGVLSQ
ncbi:MAG: hypothetical protein GY835_06145 [bacterium]|nr:hypothetical protein [bacterium]